MFRSQWNGEARSTKHGDRVGKVRILGTGTGEGRSSNSSLLFSDDERGSERARGKEGKAREGR